MKWWAFALTMAMGFLHAELSRAHRRVVRSRPATHSVDVHIALAMARSWRWTSYASLAIGILIGWLAAR